MSTETSTRTHSNQANLHLLFGFLGSGKTTLVRHLIETAGNEVPTAIIVNEFGDVGVDGDIIQGNAIDTVELNSGCLCCTLKGSLLNAAEELVNDAGAQRIIVEASGVADPEDMLDDFEDPSVSANFDICPIVTVVDAAKFNKIRSMLGEFYESQILNADIVVVNKIDLADKDELQKVAREVKSVNPDGMIYFTEQCQIEKDLVLDAKSETGVNESSSSHHHHHHHHVHELMMSIVIEPRVDITRSEFKQYCDALPDTVWRMKGFMQIDNQPVLVQYSAGQLDISEAAPRSTNRLVIIGQQLDTDKLSKGLGTLVASPES